ncbi:MAG TPA: hypothetical protein VF808_07770 [Ktedonobacterales bacterium]
MSRRDDTERQAPVWVSVVAVALIVSAVAAALAAFQRLPVAGSGLTGSGVFGRSVTIYTDGIAGITQPQGVSYSPDGAYIATLGVFTPCVASSQQLTGCVHGLAIFDAVSGQEEELAPIEPLVGLQASMDSAESGPYVSVYGIGWTPDSAWYGLIYSVFDVPRPLTPDSLVDSGLLMLNPKTNAIRVVRGDSGYFTTLGGFAADRPIWDPLHQSQFPASPLAPSLDYTWRDTNTPIATHPARGPITRLPDDADSFAPIGNPEGIGAYTIWQPGVLFGPGSVNLGGQRSAFLTTFPAWSDTGDRVGVFTAGVSLPTPNEALGIISAPASTGVPSALAPDAYIVAPARDVALTSVQERIGAYGWAQLAWSPDGALLASVVCFSRRGESIEIRDTISGSVVGQASLDLNPGDPGCRALGQNQAQGAYPHPNMALAWSPDGHQVALADAAANTITIWPVLPNK